jgi:hypothetical protein
MPIVLNKLAYSRPALYNLHPKAVYIGRPSKWGNPFIIGQDGDRAEVIRKHAAWVLTQPHLMAALPELKGKDLICFCSPEACHGDTLLRLANA